MIFSTVPATATAAKATSVSFADPTAGDELPVAEASAFPGSTGSPSVGPRAGKGKSPEGKDASASPCVLRKLLVRATCPAAKSFEAVALVPEPSGAEISVFATATLAASGRISAGEGAKAVKLAAWEGNFDGVSTSLGSGKDGLPPGFPDVLPVEPDDDSSSGGFSADDGAGARASSCGFPKICDVCGMEPI